MCFLSCVPLQLLTRPGSGAPQLIRYSAFLNLVEKGQIEKVTFSADGQKLVATDTDGQRWVGLFRHCGALHSIMLIPCMVFQVPIGCPAK